MMKVSVVVGLLLLSIVEAVTNSTNSTATWHAPTNLTTIRQTIRTTRFVTASIQSTRIVSVPGNNTSPRNGTAGPTTTPAPWTNATQILSGPDLGTYHNLTFKTLCTYSDLACYNTCMTGVQACATEYSIWSKSRDVFQSSMANLSNGGIMPQSTSYFTRPASTTTIFSYSTSWDTCLMATTVPAWGAGSEGITTYTTIVDGTPTTTVAYKSGNFVKTYTSSVPYAADKTGTPVTTSTIPATTFTYDYHTSFYSFTQPEPSCGPRSWTACSWSKDCNKCTISGGTVQLLYFPVPKTRPGIQNTTMNATARPSPAITMLETATFEGYTLTSPSVYISFQTAYAINDCGSQVGSRYPGAILPMKANELSSVYGGYGTMWSSDPNIPNFSTPYLVAGSLNLADLEWPYPITAYRNQLQYVLGREIFSIVTSPYNPVLAVPPEIRTLDSAWESCALDWEGLYDPPVALQSTDGVVAPTQPPGAGFTGGSPKGPTILPPAGPQPGLTLPPAPAPTILPPSPPPVPPPVALPPAPSAPPADGPSVPPSEPTALPDFPGDDGGISDPVAGGSDSPLPDLGGPQNGGNQSPGGQNPANPGQGSPNSGSPGSSDLPVENSGDSPSPGGPPYVFDPPGDNNDGTPSQADPATPGTSDPQPAALPTAVVVGSQTLSVGGSAATISNEVISVDAGGLVINSGSQTIPFSPPPTANSPQGPAQAAPPAPITFTAGPNGPVLTVTPIPVSASPDTPSFPPSIALIPLDDSTTLTATHEPGSSTGVAVLANPANGGQRTTLSPGGEALTLNSGQATLSAASDGVELVDGRRTTTIPFTAGPQTLTLPSTTITATPTGSGGAIVVNGQTVRPGGEAVVLSGGVTVTAVQGGRIVAVNGGETTTRGQDPTQTEGGGVQPPATAVGSSGTGRTDLLNGNGKYWGHGGCFVLALWLTL